MTKKKNYSWQILFYIFTNQSTTVCLTHWARVTHICVSKLTIIGSDNGLSPGQCQAIIWTNAAMLLIRTWGTNFSEIVTEIHVFSFKKMCLKMLSGKWWPFCLSLNVLHPKKYTHGSRFVVVGTSQSTHILQARSGLHKLALGQSTICRGHF